MISVAIVTAYRKYGYPVHDKEYTYDMPDSVAFVKKGDKVLYYIVPNGSGYECEEGHHCEVLLEHEFNKRYSLVELRGVTK